MKVRVKGIKRERVRERRERERGREREGRNQTLMMNVCSSGKEKKADRKKTQSPFFKSRTRREKKEKVTKRKLEREKERK